MPPFSPWGMRQFEEGARLISPFAREDDPELHEHTPARAASNRTYVVVAIGLVFNVLVCLRFFAQPFESTRGLHSIVGLDMNCKPPRDPTRPCAEWPMPDPPSCVAPLVPFVDTCHTAHRPESCWDHVWWAKHYGIHKHPEWYPGLSTSSDAVDFQAVVHNATPARCPNPCIGGAESGTCICSPPTVREGAVCKEPTEMVPMTFYMYRAQGDSDYPLQNVNAADLAGVLWYLHHEVVGSVPRKFGVTRLLRYKVTMKNTQEFFSQFSKQFASFVAFDSGMCTVPECDSIWQQYGFVVGCQNMDRHFANYVKEFEQVKPQDYMEGRRLSCPGGGCFHHKAKGVAHDSRHRALDDRTTIDYNDGYYGGIWYSLPGPCPAQPVVPPLPGQGSKAKTKKTDTCIAQMPGGQCGPTVTGSRNCTYHSEFAGELRLDELCGIHDYTRWWSAGHGQEYKADLDHGVNCGFWDGIHDLRNCTRRLKKVQRMFKDKYPDFPVKLPEPLCN